MSDYRLENRFWFFNTGAYRVLQYIVPVSYTHLDVYKRQLRAFLKDESGATAIEYGLIASGVALAIIAVVNGLGTKLNTKFTSISTQLH